MNKKFTKLMAALALLVFMMPTMVGWGQTKTEAEAYTFSTAQSSSNTAYATNYTITVDGVQWSCPGNQNFSGYVRIGGKSLSGVDRQIYSKDKLNAQNPYTITKITVNHNGISNSNLIVNSAKIVVASDASFNNTVETITLTPTFSVSTSGSFDFTPTQTWNSDLYYKFVFNLSNSKSSNYGLDLTSIVFYKEEGDTPQPTTYTVTYNKNGDDVTGNVPTDNNTYDATNSTVTVAGNTGNLAKPGNDWSGWCLNDGGTGTVYGPGYTTTYTISSSTTFYAKWTPRTHNVTMPTADTYGSYSASATSNVPYGTTVTLTYTPATGYEDYTPEWTVNGTTISGNTFTMPDADVLVGVSIELYYKDQIDYTFTATNSGSYTDWNNKTGASGAVYAGRTAGSSSQNYIQLNYNTSSTAGAYHSGIITTGSGGKVKKVVVTWATNGGTMPDTRVLKIYGSNTAYSATADLYDSETQGTQLGSIAKGTGTTLIIDGDYKYVGLVPDGAAYFTKIEVYWEPSTDPSITAEDVEIAYDATSGSIMYEIENYVAGSMVATTTADWISGFTYDQEDEIGEVTFGVVANTLTENRTATVTLTYTYGRSTVTEDVTVTQLSAPVIAVTPNSATVAAAGDVPEFDITYASLEITADGDFDVAFFESNGTTTSTQPEWISDYEISTGTTGYVLAVEVDENTSVQRVAYLKVWAYNNELEEVYSNLITITQSAPAQTIIDLRGTTTPVTFNAGAFTSSGTGYQSYSDVTYTGSNDVDYSGWNLNNVMHSSTNMQLKANEGSVEMPTIKTDYGFTIAVVKTGTNDVSVNDGEESGINALTTTATESDITIVADYGYAIISTITITPLSAPAEYTLTVSNLSHVNLFVFGGDESEALIEGGGEGTAQVYNGTSVEVSVDVENGYVLESLIVDGNNVTSQIDEITDMYVFTMPDHNVTITATAVLAPATDDYELFSGELVEGDYIIYYDGYAMKNTAVAVGTNRLANESVTPSSSDVISTADANIVWHIAPSGEYWTIYNVAENKYAASTGTKNQAQMLADGTDNKSLWTVTGSSNYEFVNKHNSANSINSHLRNNGTNGWACYSSQTGGVLSLYKKVEPTPATYTKDIVGNTWYFIASPTGSAPTNVDALSDLYYYDEQNHYWRNKKVTANAASLFDFDYGKGYLCANGDNENTPATVTLSFTGDLLSSNTREVNVYYHATTQEGQPNGDNGALAGWNLVGNPFNGNATLNADCFILNGSSINTTAQTAGYVISRFAGVMVKASATGTVLFTKVLEDAVVPQPNQVQIEVAQKVMVRGCASTCVHDNAIVNFNEGSQLEKFVFNPDAAKLYIPQNGKEYAIVSSEANGEMPVCFKAIKDGEYTITVSPEGVDLNYLHLIDNMTGNDVDLLQTPSYTFEASTRDYESRFRLVFTGASTDSATDESFAYFNGSEWVIDNNGEATLQVVDVMGRIISTETINGNFNLNLNQKSGVYMLRLINGENVKVQKVVVR